MLIFSTAQRQGYTTVRKILPTQTQGSNFIKKEIKFFKEILELISLHYLHYLYQFKRTKRLMKGLKQYCFLFHDVWLFFIPNYFSILSIILFSPIPLTRIINTNIPNVTKKILHPLSENDFYLCHDDKGRALVCKIKELRNTWQIYETFKISD